MGRRLERGGGWMSAPDGAPLSDDGRYWWDGEGWQEVGVASDDVGAETESSEALVRDYVQWLLGCSAQITDYAVEELSQDPDLAALYEADPEEFRSLIADIV